MHPLMHVAVYSLPGAVATCAAQYIQALQIALQATHNPEVILQASKESAMSK